MILDFIWVVLKATVNITKRECSTWKRWLLNIKYQIQRLSCKLWCENGIIMWCQRCLITSAAIKNIPLKAISNLIWSLKLCTENMSCYTKSNFKKYFLQINLRISLVSRKFIIKFTTFILAQKIHKKKHCLNQVHLLQQWI